jgi:hypothetical protein
VKLHNSLRALLVPALFLPLVETLTLNVKFIQVQIAIGFDFPLNRFTSVLRTLCHHRVFNDIGRINSNPTCFSTMKPSVSQISSAESAAYKASLTLNCPNFIH